MHDAGAREVNHRLLVLVAPGGQPAVSVPHPVHDDGVDERGEQEGVAEVRGELRALRHGAGGDGRRGGGEGPLEDEPLPVGEAAVRLVLGEEEGAGTDKRRGLAVIVHAVRDAPAEEVEGHAPDAGVEHVLDQNVHHVLRAHGAGAEHGEARLHEEHEERADEHVSVVQAVRELSGGVHGERAVIVITER